MNNIINIILCFFNGHIWSDDLTKPEIWRLKSGWISMGGFPEKENRTCVNCKKYEER